MKKFWLDLSVSKKLYIVVGVMSLLIATELFTLRFAMNTLSSVRAFVGAEGLWSKAQKTAYIHLQRYAHTKDPKDYAAYLQSLEVPLGDHQARLELEKEKPDLEKIRDGFLKGRIHPDDIDGLVSLVRRFYAEPHLEKPLNIWADGDRLLEKFMRLGEELHKQVLRGASQNLLNATITKIDAVNTELTTLEDEFSFALGEGSRWLENILMLLLILAVVTIEGTGLYLTITFSRSLSRGLNELYEAAARIGRGIFNERVPVRSKDEIGQLAQALNKMAEDIKSHVGERNSAEKANQQKSLFLANMSHEIRTPLGAILGFSDLLRDPNLNEKERQEFVEIIHRTGTNLSQVINEILDLSKVEAGKIEIEKSSFSLSELLVHVQEVIQVRCVEKSIALKMQTSDGPMDSIYSDPLRLRQILLNVLGNAVKFTEQGEISLEYKIQNNKVFFTICDSGIGLTTDESKILFQPFSQADNSAHSPYEGTGLGLVLSRTLARLLGGDVELTQSAPGKGSTFLVSIGFEQKQVSNAKKTAQMTKLESVLKGKNILVVDDVEENQFLLERILTKQGAHVSLASNGEEGVAVAFAGEFDLIVMDIQMPVMDGYSAIEKLRAEGYTKPVLALTAHAMKEDRERCLLAGFNDYLTKPIETKKFLQTLEAQL